MRRLQAAMRDRAAKNARDNSGWYRVGSVYKGCRRCGERDEDDKFESGFAVYRAYKPWETKWTWKCFECGATDLGCWAPDQLGLVEAELGKEPVRKPRELQLAYKAKLRRDAQDARPERVPRARDEAIDKLERQIAELQRQIGAMA